jgi:hypothetical protein
MATVNQMLTRMNNYHKQVLIAARKGTQIVNVERAHLTCGKTLRRWGALDSDGKLTEVGVALLRSIKTRTHLSGDHDEH